MAWEVSRETRPHPKYPGRRQLKVILRRESDNRVDVVESSWWSVDDGSAEQEAFMRCAALYPDDE